MNEIATIEVGLPAMVDRAAHTLASAHSAAEVLEARDMASVAYDVAKRAARLAKAKGAYDELLSKITRAQADALDIEAGAKRRLADEYDAAQERGEVAKDGRPKTVPDGNGFAPGTASDLGLSRKAIHEARQIRDAETAEPGIVRRTVDASVQAGEEPTRAKVRRAVQHVVKPDAETKPLPRPRGMAAISEQIRDALIALSGLPTPESMIEFLQSEKGEAYATTIGERLSAAAQWLQAFHKLWPTEEANDA